MNRVAETSAAAVEDSALRDGFADLGDVRLHYVESGSGRGLVFLHGFPEFWYAWRNQVRHFGATCHAIAPDMRGYNLSSRPEGLDAYRMRHLTEDVRDLAAALGHERITLVGHDWGGAVAWATAIRFPELVEALVIVNAPHPAIFARLLAEDPDQQKASRYMTAFADPTIEDRLLADDCAELAKWILKPGLRDGFLGEDDARRYRAAWSLPGAMTAMLAYYRSNTRSGGLTDAAALTVTMPTWVVWGMRDRALLPANLDGLEALVPSLTVMRDPDSDHWINHRNPDLVAQAIEAALAA